jgi:hypothetical protein
LQPEPISPELVLVDPVLAERERARLCEKARLDELLERDRARLDDGARSASVIDVAALRRAVEHAGAAPDEDTSSPVRRDARSVIRRTLVPAALMGSLLVNGVLAAELVVRTDAQKPVLAVPAAEHPREIVSATQPHVTSAGPSNTASSVVGRSRVGGRALPRHSMIERRLVSLILAAPARKLPPAFIDPATGLVRNNVRVTCRRRQSRSYRCAVQLPGDEDHALVVRYRATRSGKGLFTWYGYRRFSGTARFLQNH